MKNIMYGIIILVLGVLITLTIITATGIMNRQVEIDDSLALAVDSAIDNCMAKKTYTVNDNEEFADDVAQRLGKAIENDGTITVKIMNVDYEKGYIAIKVEEEYKTPIGSTRTAEYSTIKYFDDSPTRDYVIVNFLDEKNNPIRRQRVIMDTKIEAPEIENVKGWVVCDEKGNVTDNTLYDLNTNLAKEDITLKAVV